MTLKTLLCSTAIWVLTNAVQGGPVPKKAGQSAVTPAMTRFDVVVYGATAAGMAAALAAAEFGHRVALIEPTHRIGGIMTNGLGLTDMISLESLSGFYKDYADRCHQHYIRQYGADSPQAKECFFGTLTEPKVTLQVFQAMLAERPTISLFTQHRLESVSLAAPKNGYRVIQAVRLEKLGGGGSVDFSGRQFIDASYEGDLAAFAGAEYRIGRESANEYGERFAGLLYYRNGVILPGSTGEGDNRTQCYNFRITMTARPDIRVPISKPVGYDRNRYVAILPVLQSGGVKKIFSESHDGIVRQQTITNGKADINDIRGGSPVRFSLLGENYEYPDGDYATRARIVEHHKTHALGFFWFLQNDADVPELFRAEARQWGLCRDEFADTGHFPSQLYIREARRIIGEYVYSEADGLTEPGTLRSKRHATSVAVADYNFNCHGIQPPSSIYPTIAEGDFAYPTGPPTAPVQIPYGVLVPKKMANLLVPVTLSATHVGYSVLRMEPTYAALGQASGLAAHLALQNGLLVKDVPVPSLQTMLHERHAQTIYTGDVPADSRYFRGVQYFGNQGFLHVLPEATEGPKQPSKHRFSLHYTYAMPHQEVRPEALMTSPLLDRWLPLISPSLTDEERKQALRLTRGDFLNWLYKRENP